MNDEEIRLECVKLAHDWGRMRFERGWSGIQMDDVLVKADELYRFCVAEPPKDVA